MLALQRVDFQIVVAVVLAQDHPGIDWFLHANEEVAAIFQLPHRIGHRNPGLHRDQNPLAPPFDRALMRCPFVEHPVQNPGAARVGHELTVIADQTARRDMRDQTRLAHARWLHLNQIALARTGQLFDHRTGIFIIHVDGDFFDRLTFHAVNLLEQHARAGNRQFEPFAAHVFDQHAHLQFAATGNFKSVAAGGVADLDGDVDLGLFHQTFADHAGLHLGAFLAGERRVVDAKGHRNRRRINRLRRDRHVDIQSAQRIRHGRL